MTPRTRLAYKAEHVIDLKTEAILEGMVQAFEPPRAVCSSQWLSRWTALRIHGPDSNNPASPVRMSSARSLGGQHGNRGGGSAERP